jgi:16S rRNA (cytosine967-C5)-methyltransferase
VSALRAAVSEVKSSLEADGAEAAGNAVVPDSLDLFGTGALERLEAYKNGWLWVQDAASNLAVRALDPQPGDRILDACSAPGGKSFAAAVLAGGKAEITAQDIHEGKLVLVRDGAKRLGLDMTVIHGDASAFCSDFSEKFDKIICDVPCSGLGIIRKKPDIRFSDEGKAAGLPALQYSILQNVSKYLKPGGLLLYSTCTWRESENGSVVDAFLSKNPSFSTEEFTLPDPIGHVSSGKVTLWPQNFAFDGFFICLMRKNNV